LASRDGGASYLSADLDGIIGHGLGGRIVLAVLPEVLVVGLGGRLKDAVGLLVLAVLNIGDSVRLLLGLIAGRNSSSGLLDRLRLGGHLGLFLHSSVAHVVDEWRCAGGK
jgi:hypothetical protein